jgi:aspartyl-tRNA(Asn)/glutamyl-tRNA(Gln) amidotransferase subunit A
MASVRDRLEGILSRLNERAADERVFLRIYDDGARIAADAADARKKAGLSLGPLDGVIVSIKDLFDVAGETTAAGSVALRDLPPAARDATVVRRLRQAGAVIVGRTNMVEFAFSGLGLNPHHGTPANAADPERIPGGSSSGAGVSVAEGTSDIAIGSDTGGSVRIPAAFNGIVGFKPTAGRVPLDGVFPLAPSLDSVGPLAHSVQDCADADAVMAGEEPRPLDAFALAGLRIGVPRGRLFDELEPLVGDAFEAGLQRLAQAGASVVEHDIEDLLAAMTETTAHASIASIEAAEVHADWLDEGRPDRPARALVDRPQRDRPGAGLHPDAPAPPGARGRHGRTARAGRRPRPADHRDLRRPDGPLLTDDKLYNRMDWLTLRNTMWVNQFDLTAISLPVPGCPRPVGFMLVARNGRDRRLLDIAAGVEQAFDR